MADKKQTFDVIVVGSGASGGWACKRLAEAGLKVALLEAGRPQSAKNFAEHKPLFDLKYRDLNRAMIKKTRPIQTGFDICTEYNYEWFANDLDEPYSAPADKPYDWLGRVRMTGGRTNVWGRVSLRFSDFDFQAASHDGQGEDWPITYKDIEPYYDLVEEYVGICGQAEGLSHLPDGKFQPPMALTCQETLLRNRAKEKLGWTVTPTRSANLTRPLRDRAACHYCGPCERGCQSKSYFNSAFTTVADALKSGNCTLISNAMAYKVLMDPTTNRARGVHYVDRNTLQHHEVSARAVVLCAQTQESARILLNSATTQHPGGLGNSSGVLGHYFTAHIRSAGGSGEMPAFDAKPTLGGPHRPVGFYVPRFRNLQGGTQSKDFVRGYGFEGDTQTDFNWTADGFGDAYKKSLLEPKTQVGMTGFGEVLPRWDNFVEIDKNKLDKFGIPVLRIHMSNGPNETAMLKDIAESAGQLLEAGGAKNITTYNDPPRGRWAVHEAGVARMGNDAKKSVLTPFQQTHDVKNLFVMDASGFPSNPCQNPTLTIMALCVRSCDFLMGEMRKGNV